MEENLWPDAQKSHIRFQERERLLTKSSTKERKCETTFSYLTESWKNGVDIESKISCFCCDNVKFTGLEIGKFAVNHKEIAFVNCC